MRGGVPFSTRTRWPRVPNALATLRAIPGGADVVDLSESNPTRAGLACSPDVLAWLGDPRGTDYEPEPFGSIEARRAVSRYYLARGARVPADRLVLTASSSEGYSHLFHVLCDPGDTILVPRPSYPLLPYLADLAGVRLVPYPLVREERFRVDLGAVERALAVEPTPRAIVLVHPNNPTGSFVLREDADALGTLASRYGAALVVDEVFLDYPLEAPARAQRTFVGREDALTFVLSGLSKVALLPQLKLGWIALGGPAGLVDEAAARLELTADSFLSVSTPVQLALGRILDEAAPAAQARLNARLRENLAMLDAVLRALGSDAPVRRLPVGGGWYVTLEVPRVRSDDEWVALLLREDRVLVHPAYLFDGAAGDVVLSLLPEPAPFAAGVRRALARFAGA